MRINFSASQSQAYQADPDVETVTCRTLQSSGLGLLRLRTPGSGKGINTRRLKSGTGFWIEGAAVLESDDAVAEQRPALLWMMGYHDSGKAVGLPCGGTRRSVRA